MMTELSDNSKSKIESILKIKQRKNGRGGEIRTPNRRFWRPLFYQLELHPCNGDELYSSVCKGKAQKLKIWFVRLNNQQYRLKRHFGCFLCSGRTVFCDHMDVNEQLCSGRTVMIFVPDKS